MLDRKSVVHPVPNNEIGVFAQFGKKPMSDESCSKIINGPIKAFGKYLEESREQKKPVAHPVPDNEMGVFAQFGKKPMSDKSCLRIINGPVKAFDKYLDENR